MADAWDGDQHQPFFAFVPKEIGMRLEPYEGPARQGIHDPELFNCPCTACKAKQAFGQKATLLCSCGASADTLTLKGAQCWKCYQEARVQGSKEAPDLGEYSDVVNFGDDFGITWIEATSALAEVEKQYALLARLTRDLKRLDLLGGYRTVGDIRREAP